MTSLHACKVPADLDLRPYRDEHDDDLVRRMLDSIKRGVAPANVDAKRVKHAIARHMPNLGLKPATKKKKRSK